VLRRTDAAHLVSLTLLAVLAQVALRAAIGIRLPIGLDIDLWGLETMNAHAGVPTQLHPVYPALAAMLMRVAGIGHLAAGVWVSAAAAVLTPAATWGLARQLGAPRGAALTAGGVALLFPGTLSFGALVSADALTTLMLIGVAAATAAYARTPDLLRLGLMAGVLAVATITREHGLVCAGLAIPVVMLCPERPLHRVLGVAAITGAVLLAPLLVGQAPTLPGAAPWSGRMLVPLLDILDKHDATLARFPVFGRTLGPFHTVAWALTGAPFAWGWVLLAYLAFLRGGRELRAGLMVAVGPALVGLAVISQPRHVWVTLPVCAAVWLANRYPTRRANTLSWAVALGLGVLALAHWIPAPARTQKERTWREAFSVGTELVRLQHSSEIRQRTSAIICAMATPHDLWSGDPSTFTFCPLRTHRVDDEPTAANLHCWFSGEQPPSDAWRQVQAADLSMPVYRYLWRGPDHPIPCGSSAPLPTTPYHALPVEPATMDPPCEADAAWVAEATAALGVDLGDPAAYPRRSGDPARRAPRRMPQ
jgi:hypothetical protein